MTDPADSHANLDEARVAATAKAGGAAAKPGERPAGVVGKQVTVVADVIMSPVETPLLQRARAHGRRIHHGRHMLDHQIPLYLEWFGIDPKGVDVVALVRSLSA